ncbi:MAG: VWA domain-containing protein [Gammaproteobacteria bacterium]|nr:MAG: VWA domain-containing protein [Gammaproteobacteria bacterium]
MPAEFHWLRPDWLWALPAVALLTLLLARRQLTPGNWLRIIDPALVPYVLSQSQARGGQRIWWLTLLGGIIASLALAGPSWNRVERPVFRSEQAIVIALDMSRSMDAQDLPPSRLTRARLKILDLLERRKSGQTALVVYSSNAFTVTPLTTDADTVAALVNSLSTDIMPSRGSYPVAAIEKSRQLLQQAGAAYGQVLLITDGGTSPAAGRAAAALRDAGYALSVLGVGTEQGAPIPQAGGGFVTDRSGRLAVPRLETEGLRELAARGGGRYSTLRSDDRDLDLLLADDPGAAAAADESLGTDQWQEEGPWLLLLLLPLAAMAFRRGLLLVVVLASLPLARPAQAFGWQDLWRTGDQQGQELLAEGDAAAAAEKFDDPAWRAVANYVAGAFADSAAGFAGNDDADSAFNRGNALARLGRLAEAIDAYEEALQLDPDDEDAAYNRDLLSDLMQQQQDAQSDGQGGQDANQKEGGGAQQSEGQSQSDSPGQEGSSGDPGRSSEDGEAALRSDDETSQQDLDALQRELERAAQQAGEQPAGEQEQQTLSQAQAEAQRRGQEQRQAMEQWLRRIPNDPGGLLRRKFLYQYQRQGRDQDGNNLWPDDEVQPW